MKMAVIRDTDCYVFGLSLLKSLEAREYGEEQAEFGRELFDTANKAIVS